MKEQELKIMEKEELLGIIKAQQYEIERLNQYVDFYKDLTERQNKDLEKLNNIIKRLEKELFGMYVDIAGWDEDYAKKLIKKIEDSNQECELLKNNKKDVSIKSDELKCQFSDIWEYGDR